MRGILHHVTNKHEWISGDGASTAACEHGELVSEEREKPWIQSGSPAHTALSKIILDRNWLMKAGEMYCNFRQVPWRNSKVISVVL